MDLSIVVPVYKEEKNVSEFLKRTQAILKSVTDDYEVIFALDPSPDRTEEVVLSERMKDSRIKLLKFSRRFGQPMCTLGGMTYATGNAVIIMDVDLQDPPDLIPDMFLKWREGYDVVIPQRRTRTGEPWIKQFVSEVGYKVIKKIANVSIPPNTGDFRLLSRRVVDEVLQLKESHGFLRGMVAIIGYKQCIIQFDRPGRFAGETNYNRFIGSLRIGFNGIFGFSSYALTLSTQAGFLIAGCSFFLGIVYFIMKIRGFNFPLGNPTLVILILFMGGIQLISVGILGEYIGRIYEEVRCRPKFIVDQAIGLEVKAYSKK
jgi:polyisoprenyl-phosphate glycosyltransferase